MNLSWIVLGGAFAVRQAKLTSAHMGDPFARTKGNMDWSSSCQLRSDATGRAERPRRRIPPPRRGHHLGRVAEQRAQAARIHLRRWLRHGRWRTESARRPRRAPHGYPHHPLRRPHLRSGEKDQHDRHLQHPQGEQLATSRGTTGLSVCEHMLHGAQSPVCCPC